MTVYVDDMLLAATVGTVTARWSHLMVGPGDDVTELHDFAARIGLRRSWFQDASHGAEHYDVTMSVRAKAIALGAVPVTWRDSGRMLHAERTGQAWEGPEGPVQLTFDN